MQRTQRAGQLAVTFFRPRGIDIASPQTSFDMTYRNLLVIGGQGSGEGGSSVAMDQHDIGLSINAGDPSRVEPSDSDAPSIFIYDGYPGGIGFSEPLFAMHEQLLTRTRALITTCPCETGCPSCVGPVGQTGPLAKTVALRMLQLLLGAPDQIPAFQEAPF